MTTYVVDSLHVLISDLKTRTMYRVVVSAMVDGNYSGTLSIRRETLDASAPYHPTMIETAYINSTSIKLLWNKAVDNARVVTMHNIEYRPRLQAHRVKSMSIAGNVLIAEIGGLEKDTEYEFRMTATNSLGTSLWSEWIRGKTLAYDPPPPEDVEEDEDWDHEHVGLIVVVVLICLVILIGCVVTLCVLR